MRVYSEIISRCQQPTTSGYSFWRNYFDPIFPDNFDSLEAFEEIATINNYKLFMNGSMLFIRFLIHSFILAISTFGSYSGILQNMPHRLMFQS